MSETILVTGASAGFGQAICRRLVADGYRVIGSARRIEKLQALQEELGEAFYPLQMDVTDLSQVDHALASLPKTWERVDVLVNNAGLALGLAPAYEAEVADWLTMIQTNIVGLTYLTRKILPQMVERNDGYIINAMHTREGCYTYIKEIVDGNSIIVLSEEEQKALNRAMGKETEEA